MQAGIKLTGPRKSRLASGRSPARRAARRGGPVTASTQIKQRQHGLARAISLPQSDSLSHRPPDTRVAALRGRRQRRARHAADAKVAIALAPLVMRHAHKR
jgi:hypothetical protein